MMIIAPTIQNAMIIQKHTRTRLSNCHAIDKRAVDKDIRSEVLNYIINMYFHRNNAYP